MEPAPVGHPQYARSCESQLKLKSLTRVFVGKNMFNIHREEIIWGGRPLIIETGKIARQADGCVLVQYGDTTVLATATAARQPKPGLDFFPLTVNYQEKTYAAGKIPGGFFKREARPSEKETLVSRLIDRPIRPLFAKGFQNETQVIATVLSHDMENDPDIVALVAVSAALTISGIPFMGPIGAARVGFANGEYILNPSIESETESSLDLIVAGTQDAVLMVESEAKEVRWTSRMSTSKISLPPSKNFIRRPVLRRWTSRHPKSMLKCWQT